MIVKIHTKHGWRFIDKIKNVEVNESTKQSDEQFNSQCYYTNEKQNNIKVITAFIDDDSFLPRHLRIKIDEGEVYLLNDEGKTIERIN